MHDPVKPLQSPPRARIAFRVGIVGHRPDRLPKDHADHVGLRHSLRQVLTAVRAEVTKFAGADKAKSAPLYAPEPVRLQAISSLAEGADRMFAEEAIQLGYGLFCPMPFPQHEFENDFLPPNALEAHSRQRFRELLTRARESIGGLVTFELDGKRSAAGVAYGMAGRLVLNQSDLLVAVWDRGKSAGSGGTVETMREALYFRIPVLWIDPFSPDRWRILRSEEDIRDIEDATDNSVGRHSASAADLRPIERAIGEIVLAELAPPQAPPGPGQATRLNEADYFAEHRPRRNWIAWKMFRDFFGSGRLRIPTIIVADFESELGDDWSMRDGDAPASERPSAAEDWVNRRLRQHYAWADKLADWNADRYRSGYLGVYFLSAVAVLLAVLSHFRSLPQPAAVGIGVLEFASVVSILLLVSKGTKSHWHERWMEYRLLAELIRQIRILIPLGGGRPLPRTPSLNVYESLMQTWMYWHLRAIARSVGSPQVKVTPAYLVDCLRYIAELVGARGGGQLDFHKRTAEHSKAILERLDSTAQGLFFLSVGFVGIHLLAQILKAVEISEAVIDDVTLSLAAAGVLVAALAWRFVVAPLVVFVVAAVLALSAAFEMIFFGSIENTFLFLAALPAFGAALTAILNHGEFARLAKRSVAMASAFERFSARLVALQSKLGSSSEAGASELSEVAALATEITQVMVDEVSDWRVLVAEQPMRLA